MDFDFDIFQQHGNQPKPQAGMLLVASPKLREAYFRDSVVLILEHDASMGFIGLTLNKETKLTLSDLIDKDFSGAVIPIFRGGPVDEDRLFMLHTLGRELDSHLQCVPGLWVGGELEKLAEYLEVNNRSEGMIRFFLGYSGWEKDQLEEEIEQGYWGVLPAFPAQELISGTGKKFWRKAVAALGDGFKNWLLMPDDPRDN